MSFNKNASKRLSIIAGIDRESREITNVINDIVQNYLDRILKQLINVVLFSSRKTITVDDIRFLPQICPNQPNIATADNLNSLTKTFIQKDLNEILCGRKGYAIYTLKKPFDNLVRETTLNLFQDEVRIGKNVVALLQHMTEHHVITIMNHAATYTVRDNRDTLLLKDIETTLKILN